jgi:hypothetical protein
MMQSTQGKWTGRFIWASIIQGLVAVVVTILIIDPTTLFSGSGLWYSASRVIAGNGGGTWLFVGYISYIVVGVVAIAVTALFYFYIEGIQGKVYRGLTNYLAWGHLIFMNVGVVGSMFLMMRGGYLAGWAAASTASGGGGLNGGQIHDQILGWLPYPIGAFVVLAALGALLGGLGFVLRSRAK